MAQKALLEHVKRSLCRPNYKQFKIMDNTSFDAFEKGAKNLHNEEINISKERRHLQYSRRFLYASATTNSVITFQGVMNGEQCLVEAALHTDIFLPPYYQQGFNWGGHDLTREEREELLKPNLGSLVSLICQAFPKKAHGHGDPEFYSAAIEIIENKADDTYRNALSIYRVFKIIVKDQKVKHTASIAKRALQKESELEEFSRKFTEIGKPLSPESIDMITNYALFSGNISQAIASVKESIAKLAKEFAEIPILKEAMRHVVDEKD